MPPRERKQQNPAGNPKRGPAGKGPRGNQSKGPNRKGRAQRAEETVKIMETGQYAVDARTNIDIADDIQLMVENTFVYLDEEHDYGVIEDPSSEASADADGQADAPAAPVADEDQDEEKAKEKGKGKGKKGNTSKTPAAPSAQEKEKASPRDPRRMVSVGEAFPDQIFHTAPPADHAPRRDPSAPQTEVEVVDMTTLACAQKLLEKYPRVGVLNFASAKNPGGGFLKGSLAQEESLAIASALYKSQMSPAPQQSYYRLHRSTKPSAYSHSIIYTKAVPFFRNDDGSLSAPYPLDVVTSCAVNMKIAARGHSPVDVERLMEERMTRILRVFLANGNRAVVLGAYGCGVFGNSAKIVARLFKKILHTKEFRNQFDHVSFAIMNCATSENGREFLLAFRK